MATKGISLAGGSDAAAIALRAPATPRATGDAATHRRARRRTEDTLPTSLPGVVLIELAVFDDARGRFCELYRRDRYAELGITAELVQDNFSSSVAGTLRGLHYQLGAPQGKLVQVTRGEIFDVSVDIRRGSPTFGRWFGTVLSAENHRQLWIPPDFAHGFAVLSDHADVIYKCTAPYAPAHERAVRWDDAELAIAWPVRQPPILSPRDAAAPALRDAELPRYVP
ncbi:MAG TPA: dTDP-4-dehydrorhamnose 3,5-epimerase [Kofleriaceae bacterium]|nr:dTDP-4-dehydrorhamnose 3,5-epimerase [Kofleriaceae bacterium]